MTTQAAAIDDWKASGEYQYHWFEHLSAKLFRKHVLPWLRPFGHQDAPVQYLEVGVCEGMSIIWALEHFSGPGSLIVGVDPFLDCRNWRPGEGDENRRRAVRHVSDFFREPEERTRHSKYLWSSKSLGDCELHAESSQTYLPQEIRAFDVCYVDGNHAAPQALNDIIQCFRLLREGGLLIVDDVQRRDRAGMPQVFFAMRAFEDCYRGYYDVLYYHPRQICYVKRRKRRRGSFPPTLEAGEIIHPVDDGDG